jgi:hypothetical protein
MNQKPEMSDAEIEQLLLRMADSNTLNIDLTDAEIDSLLLTEPIDQAEQLSERAVLKMQEAQRKREQRLPSFVLGQSLAYARLITGLTVPEVAKKAAISATDLENLESGIWSVEQIIRKFPSVVMARILTVVKVAVQDFGDELAETADKSSSKFAHAWSRVNEKFNSDQTMEAVIKYVTELQELSS